MTAKNNDKNTKEKKTGQTQDTLGNPTNYVSGDASRSSSSHQFHKDSKEK